MSIRAIFYDLDGTLRLNQPNSRIAFTEYAAELGLDYSNEDCLRAARWEHYYFAESPEKLEDQKNYQNKESFWTNYEYRQFINFGLAPSLAAELAPKMFTKMQNGYHPQDMIPSDLPGTLQTLKHRGFLLGVLSNRENSYSEYLSELGLGDFFDISISAGEAGFYKPTPEIFRYLLQKANISAEESVYIGDNYYADVVGSRNAGLFPVLYDVHGVFDSPDCPVIQQHGQIFSLLKESNLWLGNKN